MEIIRENTKNIVSTIGYLLGVKEGTLRNEERFIPSIYDELNKNHNAKKLRALSIIRMDYLRNFKEISRRREELISIDTMADLVSLDEVKFLSDAGITTIYANQDMIVHLAKINQLIGDNVELIRGLIPSFINWNYVKDLFAMPKCYAGPKMSNMQSAKQIKKITSEINKVRSKLSEYACFYPYGTYLNWNTNKMMPYYKNILSYDLKFLKLLYAQYGDTFHGEQYVLDATTSNKASIYKFIEEANNIAVLVDCENVDPYSFISVFLNLNETYTSRINKVILYDDVNTNPAWKIVSDNINLPVEHIVVERLKSEKSLVDLKLTTGLFNEYFINHIDSFMLASSDSDFWTVVEGLPQAKFFILNESDKASQVVLDKYESVNIGYCFIDTFAKEVAFNFRDKVLYKKLLEIIDEFNATGVFPSLETSELVDMVFNSCYIKGSEYQLAYEKEVFYNRYIKKGLELKPEGNRLVLRLNQGHH